MLSLLEKKYRIFNASVPNVRLFVCEGSPQTLLQPSIGGEGGILHALLGPIDVGVAGWHIEAGWRVRWQFFQWAYLRKMWRRKHSLSFSLATPDR